MTPSDELTGQETTAVARKCDGCGRTLRWTQSVYWVSSQQGWRNLCWACAHPKEAALRGEEER